MDKSRIRSRRRIRACGVLFCCLALWSLASVVVYVGREWYWIEGNTWHQAWVATYAGVVFWGHKSGDALDPRAAPCTVLDLKGLAEWGRPQWLWRGHQSFFGDYDSRVVPLWIPLVVSGGLWAVAWLKRYRDPWECRGCGYDVRGIRDDRCPECGKLLGAVRSLP